MPAKTVKRAMKHSDFREFDEREWGLPYGKLVEEMKDSIEDRLWFSKHIGSIRKRYLNQWVAVRSRRIIMADTDHDRLLARLRLEPENRAKAMILLVEPKGTVHIY